MNIQSNVIYGYKGLSIENKKDYKEAYLYPHPPPFPLLLSSKTRRLYETQTQVDMVVDTVINIKQSNRRGDFGRRRWKEGRGERWVVERKRDGMGMDGSARSGGVSY